MYTVVQRTDKMTMRKFRWDRPLAAAIGLLAAAGFTYQGSQTAFAPLPVSASSQQVLSTSHSQELAGFAVPALLPGESDQRCTSVVYRQHGAARLQIFATDLAATRGLGQLLRVRVETGRLVAHGGATCSGFASGRTIFDGPLETFPTSSETAGAHIALPGTGDDKVAIRVSYTFSNNATNTAQGGTARLRLAYGIESA
jgi:hypothetical protein